MKSDLSSLPARINVSTTSTGMVTSVTPLSTVKFRVTVLFIKIGATKVPPSAEEELILKGLRYQEYDCSAPTFTSITGQLWATKKRVDDSAPRPSSPFQATTQAGIISAQRFAASH